MGQTVQIVLPPKYKEKRVVNVKVSPMGSFLSSKEQRALLGLIKKGVKKVFLNEKLVEVTSNIQDIDKDDLTLVPEISYEVPGELKSMVPSNIPTFFDFKNLWQKTLFALQVIGQAVLIGEKGVGKNHLCLAMAQEFSLPVYDVSGSRNLTEYDLVGHYEMRGNETVWVSGLLPIWCKHGGLLILDELSLARSSVLARIHSVFDFRRYLVIKEHQNERVDRHSHAFAIITLNPPKGEYLGTQHLNIAFLDRFQMIEVSESSFEEKKKIIKMRSDLNDEIFSESLIEIAEKINNEYKQGNLRDFVSLRNLIDCCNLIANGLSKKDAVEISILNRFTDEEEKTRVEEICSILIE
ncbi:MAG: AAA family ATPase [Candidatus Methylarchaceae archaeon HK01B]|nr:AAA family ATPase [Candidatus Methylarchaceae archaeon HK01B]